MTDSNHPPTGFRTTVTSAFGVSSAVAVADKVVEVLFLAILARLLNPADFGVAAASMIAVSFLIQFSQLGTLPALIQAREVDNKVFCVARTATLATAVVSVVAAQVGAPLLGLWFRDPDVVSAVRLSSLVCIAQALAVTPHAMLARQMRAHHVSLMDLGSSVVGAVCVSIPLALTGWGYWSLIAGGLAAGCSRAVLLYVMARQAPKFAFDLSIVRKLYARGAGFSLTVFLYKVATESDRLIVGRYLGPLSLGLYARANGLMAMPAIFYGGLADRVVFPAFSRVQTQEIRSRTAYELALSITALLGLPLTALLFFIGPDIVRVVLGPGWEGAIPPFRILCAAVYFRLADRISGTMLRGLGKPYLMAALQGLVCLIMVGGCLVGVRHGLEGVAVAVVAAATASYVMLSIASIRVCGLTLAAFLRAHGPGLAMGLVTGLVAWQAGGFAHQLQLLPFWAIVLTCACVGSVCLALTVAAPRIFLGAAGRELLRLGMTALMSRRRRPPPSSA